MMKSMMMKPMMRVLLLGIALTITFGLAASPLQAQSKRNKSKATKSQKMKAKKTTAVQAPTVAQDSWQTFSSEEGRFSVLMPGQPRIDYLEHPSEVFGKIIQTFYIATARNGSVEYVVAYMPTARGVFSQEQQFELLTTMLQNQPVVQREDISVEGIPGIAYILKRPNGFVTFERAFVVMSRGYAYQVTVRVKDATTAEATSADRAKFFNSLKLLR